MKHHLNLTEKQALVTDTPAVKRFPLSAWRPVFLKVLSTLGSSSTNLLELGLVVS